MNFGEKNLTVFFTKSKILIGSLESANDPFYQENYGRNKN